MSAIIENINGTTYYNGVPMPHVHPVTSTLWELDQNLHVDCRIGDLAVCIWVREGFQFDGASIPRVCWRLCGHPMEAPRLVASVVHDWLYRAQVCDRELADRIFNRICKDVDMSSLRTGPEYYALRWFGWAAWNANNTWPSISEARKLGHFETRMLPS